MTLSADLNARFRRNIFANNVLYGNVGSGSPYGVFFEQSNSNPLTDMTVYENRFEIYNNTAGFIPTSIRLEGTTPGVQNISVISNIFDPIYLQTGSTCNIPEPLCQTGTNGSPTYSGSGNITLTGQPVGKLNIDIP
jgi:hypothetical protein